MFPFGGPVLDDSPIRPLGDDDQRVLLQLVHKYGLNSLMCALTGLGESSRASAISTTTTLMSSNGAPSLVWTASDAASIRTQSTRDTGADMSDAEMCKDVTFRNSWLESPGDITSPNQEASMPSPRLHINTLKKYQCPMCFLDRNLVEFGRKSDFKKHLNNFHGSDVVWICRTKGCHLTFATERSYSTHAKETHKMEALPNSAARSDLCPQLVFSCGFSTCKDRLFEASNRDEAANCRDKYFEHIAKHFEDDFDVNEWEYRIQIHNLMRQSRVKSIWKTCIWPKEKRQALSWKPRSSGDLKRMLECRHLGEDISQLVRLAYILGTSPFTHSRTPPPSEIDLHFQLPYRSQCLIETDDPAKSEESGSGGGIVPCITKSRPNSVFRLSGRRGSKQKSRPSTPPPIAVPEMHMSGSDHTAGPHPGTPIPIPHERAVSNEAPTFAPDQAPQLPKQVNTTPDSGSHVMHNSPDMYTLSTHEDQGYSAQYYGQTPMHDSINMSPYEQSMSYHEHDHDSHSGYAPMVYSSTPASQVSTARPATPVPHKRPASWSRLNSMDDVHPKKRSQIPQGSPYIHDSPMSMGPGDGMSMAVSMEQVPNAYGEMIPQYHQQHQHHHHAPTSIPSQEWALPVRMGEQPQGGYHPHHQQHYIPVQQQHDTDMSAPMTFFFDDNDGRM
jgi:hypothetical protein